MSPTDRYRIGVDLGGTKIEAAVLDPAGTIVRRERRPTPRHDYDATLATVRELVHSVETGLPAGVTVGIGSPGAVSPATGRLKNANSIWLNDRPLVDDLKQVLGRPIRLANDADCFTLSEAVDGAGKHGRTVFGVILGTGVGGGVVVERRLLSGPNAVAGEWGHNPLPWPEDDERPGPNCYCGLRGCIETFLSGPGLERDHALATGERRTARQIATHAARGDRESQATLDRYASRLARALATVINVLDPDVIVLGGGLSNLRSLYERVPATWTAWIFSDRVDTRLVPPCHGDSSGVRGAAWLWND